MTILISYAQSNTENTSLLHFQVRGCRKSHEIIRKIALGRKDIERIKKPDLGPLQASHRGRCQTTDENWVECDPTG